MKNDRGFREPRRRGFDDDFVPRRPRGFAPAVARVPREQPPSGPSTTATVKWYSPDKGFGFVALADGSGDAFLGAAVVERSGQAALLQPGATLQVRIGQGQKGLQVTGIVEIDASSATAQAAPRRVPSFGERPAGRVPPGDTVPMMGRVKWFNVDKGFGFIVAEGGGRDIFVHVAALQRSGLTALAEGQRVSLQVAERPKGLEAVSIALVA